MSLGVIASSYVDSVAPFSYTNTASSGNINLGAPTSETIITGMDATGLTPNQPVDVTINLWESMNQPGNVKGCLARLRDGGPTGPIIASHAFTDAGDNTGGHQQQWSFTATVKPTSNRLCVTIQDTSNAPTVFSDTRVFTLTQPATGAVTGSPLATPFTAAVLADSPAAFWTLEAVGDFVFRDLTGNQHELTPLGGVTRGQAGPSANLPGAVLLDGSSGYLQSDVTLAAVSDWTIVCYYKGTDTGGGFAGNRVGGSLSITLSLGPNPVSGGVNGGPAYFFDQSGLGQGVYTTTKLVNDNVWHAVAGVWDGTSGAATTTAQTTLVIDGVNAGNATFQAGNTTAPVSNGNKYTIGQGGNNGFLGGALAAVAFFPTPVSTARLLAHYNAAMGG